jgi:hypothetical protein
MKTKFFLFALVVAFMACSTNDPEKKELLGTWSEPYHVDIMVKTMTFNDDGTLTYTKYNALRHLIAFVNYLA